MASFSQSAVRDPPWLPLPPLPSPPPLPPPPPLPAAGRADLAMATPVCDDAVAYRRPLHSSTTGAGSVSDDWSYRCQANARAPDALHQRTRPESRLCCCWRLRMCCFLQSASRWRLCLRRCRCLARSRVLTKTPAVCNCALARNGSSNSNDYNTKLQNDWLRACRHQAYAGQNVVAS